MVCDPGQDVTGVYVSAQHHEDIMPVMAMNFRVLERGFCQGALEAPARLCGSQAACPGSCLCPFLAGDLKQAIAL